MDYKFLRVCYWIFNLLCSSIGITAFISLIGLLIPESTIAPVLEKKEQLRRQAESDRKGRLRKIVSAIILCCLLILSIIRYTGVVNIEDVFNGQFKYIGQTLNSKAEGYGKKYTVKDTLIYEGDFVANNYEGNGKYYIYYDQDDGTEISRLKYDGEFSAGSYQGKGKIYYGDLEDVDGDGNEEPCLKYEGDFFDGQYHGHGNFYYYKYKPDVDPDSKLTADSYYKSAEYDGDWENGIRNGQGVYMTFDIDGQVIERYTGDFVDDTYNGVGILEFLDSSKKQYGEVVYHGNFQNGKISGNGIYYDKVGNVIRINADTYSTTTVLSKYPFPDDCIWGDLS